MYPKHKAQHRMIATQARRSTSTPTHHYLFLGAYGSTSGRNSETHGGSGPRGRDLWSAVDGMGNPQRRTPRSREVSWGSGLDEGRVAEPRDTLPRRRTWERVRKGDLASAPLRERSGLA